MRNLRPGGSGIDAATYVQAIPLYARNLGVLLPPLLAAVIGIALDYLSGSLFAAVGGAGGGIFSFITRLIEGYAFAISVIFADDAWRHGRGNLRAAWNHARLRAGDILITVMGFLFLTYVAGLVGSIAGPIGFYILTALAVWAFLYSIPSAAIGGVPAGGAFSVSLRTARRYPLATAVLAIVSVIVYVGLTVYALQSIAGYLSLPAYFAAEVLLAAIALGYVAIVLAKQYADFAIRGYW